MSGTSPGLEDLKKIDKRCECELIFLKFAQHFVLFRTARALVRLAEQNPSWSMNKIIKEQYEAAVLALSNRPPGAVIRVCFDLSLFWVILSFF